MSELEEGEMYVIDFEYEGTRLARVKAEVVKILNGDVGFEIVDILNVYSPLNNGDEFERENLEHAMFTTPSEDFSQMMLS